MLGLYISTEEVIGFSQANEVDMSDDQMFERELIRRILVLKDLHSANYGVDVNGKLSIIDFKVGDNYGKAEKYWASENRAERQRVARQCFKSWQLEPMIIVANDSIFQQKQLFLQSRSSRFIQLHHLFSIIFIHRSSAFFSITGFRPHF